MKKINIAIVITLFSLLYIPAFGQDTYPFTVVKTGRGSASIVLIPGLGCSGDVFNDTKKLYENKYTCYTLTMAGFAGVAPQPAVSFRNWEKAIAAFIQKNNIIKPVIVGHSIGGGLAMALAADYPDLISKVVIIDALPCLAAMTNASFKTNDSNDCSATVAKFVNMSNDDFYKMEKITTPQLLADTSKQELVIHWTVTSDRATFATMYCDFLNTDLRQKIASIKCPVLVLLESYFANFKPAMEAQFKNLSTADIRYANKGLHFIMYDDKDWYTTQLNTFIK